MHLTVFDIDCAHMLEITKRRGGKSCGQESRTDNLMPSLKAVLHLPHLMGLASP